MKGPSKREVNMHPYFLIYATWSCRHDPLHKEIH